jgi:hypothetical protein
MRTNISDATRGDLEAISTVIELFDNLDEENSDTYLFQVRRLCRELYQSVELVFKYSEGQQVPPPRQPSWAGRNSGNRDTQPDVTLDAQPFHGSIDSSGSLLPMGPGGDAGGSVPGMEPDLERYPFVANAWPPGILSFPDSTPWGMDILSGGLFNSYP